MSETKQKTLVYILGAGRSGSTILGILLGNFSEIFYPGELHYWNILHGIPVNKRQEVIKFWQEILNDFTDSECHFGKNYLKYLEHHYSIFYLPWLFKRNLMKQYILYNQKLLSVIFKKCNKNIVVDSSHYPFRLLQLRKIKGLSLKVIYLYRHPVDVVNSFQKRNIEHKYKNSISANIYLFFVSLLSLIVFYTFPKQDRLKLRYENLVEKTEQCINVLQEFITTAKEQIDINQLKTGYIFQSNRIRHSEYISINREKNNIKLNPVVRYLTIILQAPFLLSHKRSSL